MCADRQGRPVSRGIGVDADLGEIRAEPGPPISSLTGPGSDWPGLASTSWTAERCTGAGAACGWLRPLPNQCRAWPGTRDTAALPMSRGQAVIRADPYPRNR